MKNLDKMRCCWPAGSAEIIGARPRLRHYRDYGADQPVQSMRARVITVIKDHRIEFFAILGVCVAMGLCCWTLVKVLPGAIDGLTAHSRQVVAESRRCE